MQRINLTKLREKLIEEAKNTHEEMLPAIVAEVLGTPPSEPVPDESYNAATRAYGPHKFGIDLEAALDKALEECSTPYDPADDPCIDGHLEKYALKDGFTLSIEVKDTAPNNTLLHQMKQDGWVKIVSRQGHLGFEDGEESESERPDQMELGDQPEEPDNGQPPEETETEEATEPTEAEKATAAA